MIFLRNNNNQNDNLQKHSKAIYFASSVQRASARAKCGRAVVFVYVFFFSILFSHHFFRIKNKNIFFREIKKNSTT